MLLACWLLRRELGAYGLQCIECKGVGREPSKCVSPMGHELSSGDTFKYRSIEQSSTSVQIYRRQIEAFWHLTRNNKSHLQPVILCLLLPVGKKTNCSSHAQGAEKNARNARECLHERRSNRIFACRLKCYQSLLKKKSSVNYLGIDE